MEEMSHPGDATRILRRLTGGDEAAAEELLPIVYDELYRLAARAMSRQPRGHTLQATALLNEAWIRLVSKEDADWASRNHFLGVASRAMRSVLVDRARRRSVQRRDEHGAESLDGVEVELDAAVSLFEDRATDLLALDEGLRELARVKPQLARMVELRFFGGLTHEGVAEVLGVSLRSVERGWNLARAWLYARLAEDGGAG